VRGSPVKENRLPEDSAAGPLAIKTAVPPDSLLLTREIRSPKGAAGEPL
jgi:hypothetical protein